MQVLQEVLFHVLISMISMLLSLTVEKPEQEGNIRQTEMLPNSSHFQEKNINRQRGTTTKCDKDVQWVYHTL